MVVNDKLNLTMLCDFYELTMSQGYFKTGYADNVGMLCGAMANPFALDFADPDGEGEDPAVAYATVYPASIFLRVISAQIIMLIFL